MNWLSWVGFASLVLGAVALIVASALLAALRRVTRRLDELERALHQSDQHYQGLSAGAVGYSEHLLRVERDMKRLKERLEMVASTDGGGTAFTPAIRMASKGATAEEIMEACGLTQVEADLVVLLHRNGEPGGG